MARKKEDSDQGGIFSMIFGGKKNDNKPQQRYKGRPGDEIVCIARALLPILARLHKFVSREI